jgi:glycine/D-amino acid oxidase-like deaminating enzyme
VTISHHPALIIGAGVVGLSTALYLQRDGMPVTVLDPLGPAGGASFGNAGMLSPDTAAPIAMPGMLRKVPGWLRDPLGPLAVRPSYFPRALPWLWQWVKAGRLDRVLAVSDAMRALHCETLVCWRELLGDALYHDLIRPSGQVHVWEGDDASPTEAIEQRIRDRHGIQATPLDADDLRQMFPGIARDIRRGLHVPGNGHTVSPQRIVATLGELLRLAGGTIITERAMKLIPREGGGYIVMTNRANRVADRLVVAAGAWSARLLAPLGIRVPLETERGYHAMLFAPSMQPAIPISSKSRAFFMTPMEDGLRIAGTVEIAGLDAPPDERRAMVLMDHARRLFPALEAGEVRTWMGFRPSTPDSLPILGPVAGHPGLHLAFGHGHFGMSGGPPSGRLLSRLITGAVPGINPAPYGAQRFSR